jgi:DNA-binding response OmpR family regulator
MVVDDEPENQLLIKVILSTEGYEVVGVEQGQQVVERATAEQPDLILLDVMMPDLNGFRVFEALRANEPTRNTPVVMLSALTQQWDVEKAINLGVNDYLTKPFEPEDLVARVEANLRGGEGASG